MTDPAPTDNRDRLAKARKAAAAKRRELKELTARNEATEAELEKLEAPAAELAAVDQELNAARVRLAFVAEAVKNRADLDLTWLKVSGSGLLDGLDATAAEFPATIAQIVADHAFPAEVHRPGDGDQGPRGGGSKQLTREDLKDMTHEDIDKARLDGRLTALLAGDGRW